MTVTKSASAFGVLNMLSALAASLRVAYVAFHHFLMDEQSERLMNFYNATGGGAWKDRRGWLLTTTAKQYWYGVGMHSQLKKARRERCCRVFQRLVRQGKARVIAGVHVSGTAVPRRGS